MKKLFILSGCLFALYINLIGAPQKMIISASVADVRSRPEAVPWGLRGPVLFREMQAQDSQALFCDHILAENVQNAPGWAKVTVLGQKLDGFMLKSNLSPVSMFPQNTVVLKNLWTPLFSTMDTGRIVIKELALGTMLEAQKINNSWWAVFVDGEIAGYLQATDSVSPLSPKNKSIEQIRKDIVDTAQLALSTKAPYVWGGVSPYNKNLNAQITGFDCSGLTYLCYRACGLEIPRNSRSQHKTFHALESGQELKKADLIFRTKPNQKNCIAHVMLYIGDGETIEASGMGAYSLAEAKAKGFALTDLCVKKTSVKESIGVDVAKIESGKTMTKDGKYIFLGSYF